jgi:hypothetical protein
VSKLIWHCLDCGDSGPVEPTGDGEEYGIGDHEPCITCGSGTAYVTTIRVGACYEQGLALGMDRAAAWLRAQAHREVTQ